MEIPPQHSIDIRPIEVPAASRFMEVVIVVLMGVTVLGMAFLFYNQAVLLERINANQDMLRSITNQVRPTPRVALVPETAQGAYVPPPSTQAAVNGPPPTRAVPAPAAPQPTPAPARRSIPHPTVRTESAPRPPVAVTPPASTPAPARRTAPPVVESAPTPAAPKTETARSENAPEATAPPATPAAETPAPAAAPAAAAATGSEQADSSLWKNYGPTILQTIDELYKGDYDSVTSRFTKQYAQDLPKSKLAHIMDLDRSKYGTFKRVLGHQLDDRFEFEDRKIFKVTIDTDQNRIIVFTIALNPNKEIMSLYFQPVVLQEG